MDHIEKAIRYVRKNVDTERVSTVTGYMYLHRSPLHVEDPHLEDDIHDLMEEYGADNDLPEGWWQSEVDENDIVLRLLNDE